MSSAAHETIKLQPATQVMIAVHPQFITDQTGKKQAAVIPIAEFKALMDALEDLEDVRAYDDAKAADEESLPAEQVFAMIEAERAGK